MEMVWLFAGFIIGVAAVWIYFNTWFKRQMSLQEAGWAKQESGWANACRKAQETADLERAAHRETGKQLTALEAKQILERNKTAVLSVELKSARDRLDSERRRLMKAKQLLSQAESDRSAVAEWADALRLELETARFRIAQNENTFPDHGRASLAQFSTNSTPSQNWLKMERLASIQSEKKPRELSAAGRISEPQAQETIPVAENTDDDLTWLKGMKGKLNQVGITSFRQIAGFPEADIAQADENPDVRDCICRKPRVEPAQTEPSEEMAG